MKLIEILVRDLPKRGGWPVGIDKLVQNSIGCVYQAGGGTPLWRLDVTQDWELAEISRGEYYIALDASKEMLVNKPVAWDGQGLPPVGCECELYDCEKWIEVRIKYTGDNVVVVHEFGSVTSERVFHLAKKPENFRPIRTEAERKREQAVEAISQVIEYRHGCSHKSLAGWICSAIAAGKIPGVKLEAPDA